MGLKVFSFCLNFKGVVNKVSRMCQIGTGDVSLPLESQDPKVAIDLLNQGKKFVKSLGLFIGQSVFNVPVKDIVVKDNSYLLSSGNRPAYICLQANVYDRKSYQARLEVMSLIFQAVIKKQGIKRKGLKVIDFVEKDTLCQKIKNDLVNKGLITDDYLPVDVLKRKQDILKRIKTAIFESSLLTRKCPICGGNVQASPPQKQFCSKTCKQKKYRLQIKVKKLIKKRKLIVTKENILSILKEAETEIKRNLVKRNRKEDYKPINDLNQLAEIIYWSLIK